MTDRENEVLKTTLGIIKKRLMPERVYLFGSRAKGRALKGSDFDIAVDSKRPEPRTERRLLEEVNDSSGLYKVDIVYLQSVDRNLREIILKTGKVIYERKGN